MEEAPENDPEGGLRGVLAVEVLDRTNVNGVLDDHCGGDHIEEEDGPEVVPVEAVFQIHPIRPARFLLPKAHLDSWSSKRVHY